MGLSRFLAAVIGWYFIIFGLLIILRYKVFERMAREISHSATALALSGMIALILGLLLVVSHSIWTPDWRFIVTLIGWLILIKGISRLYFPNQFKHLAIKWLQHKSSNVITAIILLIIGIFLIYCAYS